MKRIFPSGSTPAAIVVLVLATALCRAQQGFTVEQVETRFEASNREFMANGIGQSALGQSAGDSQAEIPVASTRARSFTIAISTSDGRMHGGENKFCAVFQGIPSNQPVEVADVGVDFVLLVGRIHEAPIKARLARDRIGRFCGQVNLGKQFYDPASYYALVSFTGADGRKRKKRLILSVR